MLYLYDEKSCKLTTSKVENFRWASAAVENSLVFFMHWRSDWSRTSIRCQPQDVASSYYISVPRWWHQEGKVTLKGRTTRLERLIDLILAADGSLVFVVLESLSTFLVSRSLGKMLIWVDTTVSKSHIFSQGARWKLGMDDFSALLRCHLWWAQFLLSF